MEIKKSNFNDKKEFLNFAEYCYINRSERQIAKEKCGNVMWWRMLSDRVKEILIKEHGFKEPEVNCGI